MSIHNRNKEFIGGLRAALYDIDASDLQRQLRELFAADCQAHLAHPLESLPGIDALYEGAYLPLLNAVPDLERRDFIVMAGESRGQNWVGCAGHYMGLFEQPWLDIPPTKHLMAMRYHEFFRIEDERIVEMQALWDIPQVMMGAGAWPLAPSLAVEWIVPGPASNDGIITSPYDEARSQASLTWVRDMLVALKRNTISAEAMELDKYWHPKMMWYGPAGIGSMRRISGFRHWHQIPFLKAMPDRDAFVGTGIMFGDGDYVGFTAWPGMTMTISGDGWLGIAPSNQAITMRSLDFWRMENRMIRENWVLVDLLDVYHQLGVDVFERMRELTVARRSDIAV
ncbi:MAG: ester cyclase [Chloroflexi bacterium]|nr:ester cyclase [Chloroflexota bacterium]